MPKGIPVRSRQLLDNTVDMPTAEAAVDATNPANSPEQRSEKMVRVRRRIPMNIPRRKLEVPDLPGFHMHWISGDAARVAQAHNAGYTFVEKHELPGYLLELGDQTSVTENAESSGRISVLGGGVSEEDGQAIRLYLMKLPNEFYEDDLEARDEDGEKTIMALRGDPNARPSEGGDNSNRYIPKMGIGREKPTQSKSYNALEAFRKR